MIVDYALYENGVRHEGELALDHLFETCHGPRAFAWIGSPSSGACDEQGGCRLNGMSESAGTA